MVNITIRDPEDVRAFVNIRVRDEGRAYCSIRDVMDDDDQMQIVIEQAKTKLTNASKLLKTYEELYRMATKIDSIVLELNQ